MQVNEKTRLRVTAGSRPSNAEAIRAARKKLGFTQTALAQALASSQDAVSRWERGIDNPPPRACLALAKLVPDEDRPYWLEASGVAELPGTALAADVRTIPLLRDSAAAGTPRAIDEREIDQRISLPKEWLPRGGSLYAVKVSGDSMAPILLDGHIVIIDVSRRDPERLVFGMVAARDNEGVTIKWLRKANNIFSLVPQHTAPEYEVQYLQPLGEFAIVGEVVKWIGEPPKPKRRK